MSDETLKSLLMEDVPPARDLAFEIAVMQRIERERFRKDMALNLVLAVASALLLALVAPLLEGFWQQALIPHVSDLVVAALLMAATYLGLRYYATRD